MPLSAGTKLGPYEILALIGKGGMGEVYRARDTKLKRDVALKVLPEAFARDPERMARFQREAEVLASLNHPNIAAIYGFEERALVMELVEGDSPKGPLPFGEAWHIASQIATALEYAHERGVIHRDLKPANVKITAEGVVKLLDFGLAKAMTNPRETTADAGGENSSTLTMGATEMGVILGTAAYMSPEQARGKKVDKRADIWAFGVVLYELLTGQHLFQGETTTDILAAIVKEEPDWKRVPAKVQPLLRRCLEKDPKRRLRDIGDFEWLLDQASVAPQAAKSKVRWAMGAAALVLVLALMVWGWWRTRPAEQPLKPLVRLNVDLEPDVCFGSLFGASVVLSPDSSRLVYVSQSRLFSRRLDQPKSAELVGTEGAAGPFFSPDGQWVAFYSQGKLKKVPVDGGPPSMLTDSFGGSASWGDDGNIIFSAGGGVSRIQDVGGTPTPIFQPDGNSSGNLRYQQILPGGKTLLVITGGGSVTGSDAENLEVISLEDHRRKMLQRGATFGQYLPTGHLVYVNRGTLFAVRFDLDRLEIEGAPIPVLEQIAYSPIIGSSTQLNISKSGTLVYCSATPEGALSTVQWLDSAGNMQPLLSKPGPYLHPRLSPDGRRLAMELREGANTDIWVYEWQRDTMTRVTLGGPNGSPLWTPDNRGLVYIVMGKGLFWASADGAPNIQPLTQDKSTQLPQSFMPDGKRLSYFNRDGIWTLQVENTGGGLRAATPELFLKSGFRLRDAAFSPDGRWIAYTSDESGTNQIYVTAFPGKGSRWQVSNNGGVFPMFSRNGRELFFETEDHRIIVASYAAKGDSFVAEKPRVWSEKKLGGPLRGGFWNYDLAPDGKRIAALMPAEAPSGQSTQSHVIFIQNFFDELRRKVPGK